MQAWLYGFESQPHFSPTTRGPKILWYITVTYICFTAPRTQSSLTTMLKDRRLRASNSSLFVLYWDLHVTSGSESFPHWLFYAFFSLIFKIVKCCLIFTVWSWSGHCVLFDIGKCRVAWAAPRSPWFWASCSAGAPFPGYRKQRLLYVTSRQSMKRSMLNPPFGNCADAERLHLSRYSGF